MPGHRFFVPELPLFGLLLGASVGVLTSVGRREPVQRVLAELGVTRGALAGFVTAAVAASRRVHALHGRS